MGSPVVVFPGEWDITGLPKAALDPFRGLAEVAEPGQQAAGQAAPRGLRGRLGPQRGALPRVCAGAHQAAPEPQRAAAALGHLGQSSDGCGSPLCGLGTSVLGGGVHGRSTGNRWARR